MLGIFLERGLTVASAQVGPPAASTPAKPSATPAEKLLASRQKKADDATYEQLAKQYDQFQVINRTFELVARSVGPTVVHIIAHKKIQESRTVRGTKKEFDRQVEETGSGVIIRSDRSSGLYVLTNHHVIDGAKPADIRISLQDGRSILPLRFWNDPKADIAVLQLDRDDLPAARLGNSDDCAVGSWVMALGSPFGLTHSVSQGIISARGRHMVELSEVENQDFLQTDAAINPGNSGGPLVNMKGEVIGINNSIASNGGGNEGVGFSIPINLARWIMNDLIAHGRVTRGALGVTLESNFRQEVAASLGMERPKGALIGTVHPSSPAFQAGLRDGDVVLKFGGVEISDLNHLINTVSMAAVGQSAEVVVWRNRQEIKVVVKVGERERTFSTTNSKPAGEAPPRDPSGLIRRPNQPADQSSYALGLELTTLDGPLALNHNLPEQARGALIVTIDPESPLVKVVRPKDVITTIDDKLVESAEQAATILNQRADNVPATIDLLRQIDGSIERYKVQLP
jgi:serine protease Do